MSTHRTPGHLSANSALRSSPLRRPTAAGWRVLAAACAATLALANAQAQSSVSLYGLVDVGLRHDQVGPGQKIANGPLQSQNQVLSGGLSNSYFGLRGREDLGGGLAAVFDLESGFVPGTGQNQQTTAFFDRRAAVGLAYEGWGSLWLGRNTTFAYDLAASGVVDPLQRMYNSINSGGVSYGSGKSGAIGGLISARLNPSNTLISGAFATDRNNNMLKYNGQADSLSWGLSYATAGAGEARAYGAFGRWTSSEASVALSAQRNTDTNGYHATLYSLGGFVDLGDWRVQSAIQQIKVDDLYNANTSNPLESVDSTGVIALAPTALRAQAVDTLRIGDLALSYGLTPQLKLTGAWFRTELSGNAIASGRSDSLLLVGRYSLSARSTLYAGLDYTQSHDSLAGPSTKGSNTGLTTGLHHLF